MCFSWDSDNRQKDRAAKHYAVVDWRRTQGQRDLPMVCKPTPVARMGFKVRCPDHLNLPVRIPQWLKELIESTSILHEF